MHFNTDYHSLNHLGSINKIWSIFTTAPASSQGMAVKIVDNILSLLVLLYSRQAHLASKVFVDPQVNMISFANMDLDKIICTGHHLGLEVGRLPLGAGRAKMTLDLGPDLITDGLNFFSGSLYISCTSAQHIIAFFGWMMELTTKMQSLLKCNFKRYSLV